MNFDVRITSPGQPIVYRTAIEFRKFLVNLYGDDGADIRMMLLDSGKKVTMTIKGVLIEAQKV